MGSFIYGISLQWKLDLRNKGVLLTYYIVPLVFFGFIGGIFTSITPDSRSTLIQSMSIFGISMGAILGAPIPISEIYGSELKKAYKIGGIPMYIPLITNLISAFIHLFIMSTIIFFIAPLAFHADAPENLPLYFINVWFFLITSLSVGAVLGLAVRTPSKLGMISQFIFLPSLMLSGIMFPAKMLPKALAALGKLFPATWGFELMKAGTYEFEFLLPLLIIVTLCVFTVILLLKKQNID